MPNSPDFKPLVSPHEIVTEFIDRLQGSQEVNAGKDAVRKAEAVDISNEKGVVLNAGVVYDILPLSFHIDEEGGIVLDEVEERVEDLNQTLFKGIYQSEEGWMIRLSLLPQGIPTEVPLEKFRYTNAHTDFDIAV